MEWKWASFEINFRMYIIMIIMIIILEEYILNVSIQFKAFL